MRTTIIFLSLWMVLCFTMSSQSRVVLNNNAYVVITNSVNLVVDNSATNGITTLGTGGNILSEGEFNVVKWNIGTAAGNYIVPFTTRTTLTKIPLSVNITSAGTNTGSIVFSTYETATDLNTAYPSDVTNMNSNCNTANALYAVDRFWRIDAINYTTKPTPVINFGYDDAANELSGTNTITESRLKAERFNSILGVWETPQKLYGLGNSTLNTVSGVSVTPVDFYKSWTLIDTVIMTIPINQLSANSSTICSGNSVTITPTGALTYTLLPDGLTGTSFTVSPTTTLTYSVSGTNAAGCTSAPSSYATTTVIVNATPTVAVGSISSNTICSGSTLTLTPSGANTYTLLPDGVTGTTFTLSPISTSIYTINGASTDGCISTSSSNLTQTITVNSTPTIALGSITSNTICAGNTAVITPTGATSYTLLPGNLTGTVFTVSPTSSTIYTVTGSDNNNCVSNSSSVLSTSITVSNMLITILNQSDVLCYGTNTGSASIVVTGGIPSYTYSWINGSTTSTVSNLQVGVNTVTVTDNISCVATGSVILSEPSSSVSISSSSITSACPGKSNGNADIVITGGTPTYSVSWNTGATGTTLLDVETGTYVATITDGNGCVLSEMIIIPLLSSTDIVCEDLFIPEIFSPNGDGLNEKFEIKKVGAYPNNSISIFNRWGSLIYKKDKYSNDWDGKANIGDAIGSKTLPAGTYYVVFEFGDNETKPYTGFVQLEY